MVLEVDVEPLASGGTSLFYREGNQLGSDPASPHARGHNGVQNERVDAPVPRDVDEAHELVPVACADPAEAVSVYPAPPVVFGGPVIEAFRMKPIDLTVVELPTPGVGDHSGSVCSASGGRADRWTVIHGMAEDAQLAVELETVRRVPAPLRQEAAGTDLAACWRRPQGQKHRPSVLHLLYADEAQTFVEP